MLKSLYKLCQNVIILYSIDVFYNYNGICIAIDYHKFYHIFPKTKLETRNYYRISYSFKLLY